MHCRLRQEVFQRLRNRMSHDSLAASHRQVAKAGGLPPKPDDASTHTALAQALAQIDHPKDAIAAASGQAAVAEQVEEWLSHYQTELRRAAEAALSNPPPPANEAKKPR